MLLSLFPPLFLFRDAGAWDVDGCGVCGWCLIGICGVNGCLIGVCGVNGCIIGVCGVNGCGDDGCGIDAWIVHWLESSSSATLMSSSSEVSAVICSWRKYSFNSIVIHDTKISV